MATANPPAQNIQDLHVVGPQAPQAPQAPAAPAATPQAPAAPKDHVDSGPAEDRILSPEETENFFRTGSLETPEVQTPEEVTQEQMAGEFFAQPTPGTVPPVGATQVQPPVQPLPVLQPQAVQAAVQGTLQQGQPTPAAPVQPPQVVPGAAPGAPAVPQQTPQETALAAQLQQMQTQVTNLTAQVQTAQQAALTATQTQGQAPAQPQFNMQIPQEYVAALNSEDPTVRQQALNTMINGIAQAVHQRTMTDVDQRIQGQAPIIQQQITAQQEAQAIKQDMYSTYPELNNMMEQVAAVAQQMQSQGLSNGSWSADLRDSIAERLSPMIPGLAQKVQAVRSARLGQTVPQLLPQGQPQGLPPGVTPAQIVGGAHVPAAQNQGPMLVRDAYGNYSQVYPQQNQQLAGPQARPGMQGQVDPMLQDIWSTLGY